VKHRFLTEALAEYEDAVVYYEGVNPGLGTRFIVEVDDLLDAICEFPRAGSRVPDTPPDLEIRRRLLRAFSVEVDYMIEKDHSIVVLAIFHSAREPGYWRARLRRSR
jgi:plasmid stabilization system protein ParE